MWAQYADNHCGVCIVLDQAGLDQAIRKRYPERDFSWVLSGTAQYIETPQEDVMSSSVELTSADQAREYESISTGMQSGCFSRSILIGMTRMNTDGCFMMLTSLKREKTAGRPHLLISSPTSSL